MGNPVATAELTAALAARHRVLMLGGLAVISHGHSRPTYDADIWLDATLLHMDWATAVTDTLSIYPGLRFVAIGTWVEVPPALLGDLIQRDGVVRVMGASQPLDIFRDPNELDITEFDDVWNRATALDDGTRVPDTIDLLVTKQATGRDKDMQDIAFLEAKAEREYLAKLPTASAEQAASMLARFLTPKVAEAGLHHPAESVRHLSLGYLKELAAEGDPFARDILEK
ncbi:MAG: hypothetical protein V4819_15100 [Verrucomicrobiota bacterium]